MFAPEFNKDGWYNIDDIGPVNFEERLLYYSNKRKSRLLHYSNKRKRRILQYSNERKSRLLHHSNKRKSYGRVSLLNEILVNNKRLVTLKYPKISERIFNITADDEQDNDDDHALEDEFYGMDNDYQQIFDQKWPSLKKHLFNVVQDPEERNDLQSSHPDILEEMRMKAREFYSTFVQRDYPNRSEKGNPKYFDNIWSSGWC